MPVLSDSPNQDLDLVFPSIPLSPQYGSLVRKVVVAISPRSDTFVFSEYKLHVWKNNGTDCCLIDKIFFLDFQTVLATSLLILEGCFL